MIIYITTNLINGKKYIGKDETNNPKYLGSGLELKHAIKKYGRENFIKETLAVCNNRIELNILEEYYIKYYNAQLSSLFYNIAPGGTGGILTSDYSYLEVPVYEVNPVTFEVIKEYKSSKEAATQNNLNYKCLNAVCNKSKRYIKNRLFVFVKDYNKYNLKNSEIPYKLKYIHLSLKTGIYYYSLEHLYMSEFLDYKTFSSFKNYIFKHKDKFLTEFITERI